MRNDPVIRPRRIHPASSVGASAAAVGIRPQIMQIRADSNIERSAEIGGICGQILITEYTEAIDGKGRVLDLWIMPPQCAPLIA